MTSIRIAFLAAAAALSVASQALASTYGQFRVPAGNIGCGFDANYLRCDVNGGVKPLPPRPKDCQLDWGGGISMNRTGMPDVECAGDTANDRNSTVIPAGTTWRRGSFACRVQTSSIRCTNAGGHGFFLSTPRSYRF